MFKNKAIMVLTCVVFVAAMLAPLARGQAPEPVTLTGILEMGEAGLVLRTGEQTYLLDGVETDELLGKQVTVTGTFDESPDGPEVFIVESITE